jgi:hypothetical protein
MLSIEMFAWSLVPAAFPVAVRPRRNAYVLLLSLQFGFAAKVLAASRPVAPLMDLRCLYPFTTHLCDVQVVSPFVQPVLHTSVGRLYLLFS